MQDFARTEEIGGFASAVTAEPVIEKPAVIEKPTAEPVVEKPPVEETKPAVVEKTAVEDKLSNPNLAEEKPKPKVEEEETVPAGMTKPAQESWKKIRAAEKQAKAERDDARKEIETIRAELTESGKTKSERDQLKKELEETKQRLADYDQEISITRVEATKDFKARITAPLKDISESVSNLAKRYELAPETLLRAIQEPDEDKRADLMDDATTDMKRTHQIAITQAATDYHRLQKQADEMRSNASKTLEDITRQQREESEKASTKVVSDYRAEVGNQWKAVQDTIPELRKVHGQDAWNKHLDGLQLKIEGLDVNDLPVSDVAKFAAHYHAMPEVLSVLKHFKDRAKSLETLLAAEKTRVAGLRVATPGAGAGSNGNGTSDAKDTRSFSKAVFDE